ncbi:fungal-specific transcription factor domain-containing protein [Desarmillaria tabescens]|uniref:Fungal-specific transcription factor domain-containing protein n=1 Tax=Armillaria tabescens TaxID=1929756 RepID=A0AA39IZZ5_ARMTA|nr:fungal-specific transcription factor domain-containing protein [Desarmillaria tabescens]KAK0432974.1 fungal-specific transcription factor domain-containing protein [Desarmillaria tabescens]
MSSETAVELDDDFTHLDLVEKMKNLSLKHDTAFSGRCFGPSSSLVLFINALSTKRKLTGRLNTIQLHDYSNLYPWEQATADAEKPFYVFPDNDLIMNLVAIYFGTINPILPILHRPTFTKDVANGLHLRDEKFGAVLLHVLHIASRYSDDPRVLADPSSRLSAGWRFLVQARLFKKAVLAPPSLYEIQQAALGVICSMATSVPQFSWTVIGLGLRAAVEIGLHRQKPKGHKPTVDDELKKRSFWALVTFDRLLSLYLGRPITIQEEEYVVLLLPVECDDEYWDIGPNGEVHFCQPADKPSKISYFNAQIRLGGIMSVVARNLYSIKKGRDMLGLNGKDEQRIVSDMDSSMNAWMNAIPDHCMPSIMSVERSTYHASVRWDPERDNTLFLHQSAVLYNTYYMLQIHIHRPFLRTVSSFSTSSLAISTIAARSCTRILQVHLKRIKFTSPHLLMSAFMSGTVLAMNIWSRKRASHPPNANDLASFEECLATFIHAADTWNVAGRSLKMFKGMASFETASVLDGTSTAYPPKDVGPVSAPIWESHYNIRDASPKQMQQFASTDPKYSDSHLETHAGASQPLDWTDVKLLNQSQSSFFDIAESHLSGGVGTIDRWTLAPPGFDFAEWDTYVNSMGLENGYS